MKKRFALATLFLAIIHVMPAFADRSNPNNKLAAFESSGAWEVWCIAQGGTGRVVCDLNTVLVYKPRPDFRALILRLFLDSGGRYRVEFDTERQTSLRRGYMKTDEGPPFDLSSCPSPCILLHEKADQLVELLSQADRATLHMHDYLVQRFDVEIDLDGFSEGLERLKRLQKQFRR